MKISKATKEDLEQILELQKDCYLIEATLHNDFTISPLHQTLENVTEEFSSGFTFLKMLHGKKIIGSVRAYEENQTCYIGKLIVDAEYQNKGLGQMLLTAIENEFSECDRYELFTGYKSEKNLYLYKKLNYREFERIELSEKVTLVFLEKNTLVF